MAPRTPARPGTGTLPAGLVLSLVLALPLLSALSLALPPVRTSVALAPASIEGQNANDAWGESVAVPGDLDGDGVDDLVVASPMVGGDGAVAIFFGGTLPSANTSVAAAPTTIDGPAGGQLRVAAGRMGDLDGDGTDDLVIAAPCDSTSAPCAGSVAIFLGRPLWAASYLYTDADSLWSSPTASEELGRLVVGGGDLDGDGRADLLVGGEADPSGSLYVLLGRASWPGAALIATASRDYSAAAVGAPFPSDGAIAPDLDGDGDDELVVSSSEADHVNGIATGAVYRIDGTSPLPPSADIDQAADARIDGLQQDARFGASVAGVGDVTGDGMGDLLVGAPEEDVGVPADGGVARLFVGGDPWPAVGDTDDASLVLQGAATGDSLGSSLGSVVDLQGDGIADLVIGCVACAGKVADGGALLLLPGSTVLGGTIGIGAVPSSFGGISAAVDSFATIAAGDLDGDGLPEVVHGAPSDGRVAAGAGSIFIEQPETNTAPSAISGIALYGDAARTLWVDEMPQGGTLTIALNATDGDGLHRDVVSVRINGSSDATGWTMALRESAAASGVFVGTLRLGASAAPLLQRFVADPTDVVRVATIDDSLSVVVNITAGLAFSPPLGPLSIEEDDDAVVPLGAAGSHFYDWALATNASFLSLNDSAPSLEGTADNGAVGSYYVNVTLSDAYGQSTFANVSLSVTNVAPTLLGTDLLTATQGSLYSVDYDSDDDGAGTVTYALVAGPAWLSLNATDGVLSGTPGPQDVQVSLVNVSVDDGHGGIDGHDFVLEVTNVNDPPQLLTDLLLEATEDQPFLLNLTLLDPDAGDNLTLALSGNATFLQLNASGPSLYGTPGDLDVGLRALTLTLRDANDSGPDVTGTILVHNINDAPTFLSVPPANASVDSPFVYVPSVLDPDPNTTLRFRLLSPLLGPSIDEATGTILWTPSAAAAGAVPLQLLVTDGMVEVVQEFTVRVAIGPPDNVPPTVAYVAPANGSTIEVTNPSLSWTLHDEDPYDDAEVAFDVYLSDSQTAVTTRVPGALVAQRLHTTSYLVENALLPGEVYYWSVQPQDPWLAGSSESGVWRFTVSPDARLNSPPTITTTPPTAALVGQLYRYTVGAVDPDSTALSFALSVRPAGMTIDASLGMISWTPVAGQKGDHEVTVVVSDGVVAVDQHWTVGVRAAGANHAPEPVQLGLVTAVVNQTTVVELQATDGDEDTLSWRLVEGPNGAKIASGAIFTFTPTPTQVGDYDVVVEVTDGIVPVQMSFPLKVGIPSVEQPPVRHPAPVVVFPEVRSIGVGAAVGLAVGLVLLAIVARRRSAAPPPARKAPPKVEPLPTIAPIDDGATKILQGQLATAQAALAKAESQQATARAQQQEQVAAHATALEERDVTLRRTRSELEALRIRLEQQQAAAAATARASKPKAAAVSPPDDDGPPALSAPPSGGKKGKDKGTATEEASRRGKRPPTPSSVAAAAPAAAVPKADAAVAPAPVAKEPAEADDHQTTADLDALATSSAVDRLDTDSLLEELERDLSSIGPAPSTDDDDSEGISKKILEDL